MPHGSDLAADVVFLAKERTRLEGLLRKAETENRDLRGFLGELKQGGCWCGSGTYAGQAPHTPLCARIRKVLEPL